MNCMNCKATDAKILVTRKQAGKKIEVCDKCVNAFDKAARKAYDQARYEKAKKDAAARKPVAHTKQHTAPAAKSIWTIGEEYKALHYKQQKAYIRACKDVKTLEAIVQHEAGNKCKVRLANKCIHRLKD